MISGLDKNLVNKQGIRKKEFIYQCEICNFTCMYPAEIERHISSKKHKSLTNPDYIVPSRYLYCKLCDVICKGILEYDIHITTPTHCDKICNGYIKPSKILYCEICHVKCSGATDYNRHLSTSKHACKIMEKSEKSREQTSVHVSVLSPENIVHNTSENDHIMQCVQTMLTANTQMVTTFMEAQAAHAEAREEAHAEAAAEQNRILIEAISLNGPQCITNNTTNNQFNLNVFLNEDCKDAFTLKEVADSIECTVSDLDRMDTDGYAATITRKILESMQNMSIAERPIHCTDARRNTVCVKSKEGWERNEAAMKCLNDTVYWVGNKLSRIVGDWRVAYPDHFRGTDSRREQYHRLIMDVTKVRDLDVEARIASKICKGVVLDRKVLAKRDKSCSDGLVC